MNLSVVLHLKNKYPTGKIFSSESGIDVYVDQAHKVAIRKNGAGQWVDQSEVLGAEDKFCLAPIPKDSRLFKMIDGKVSKVEEYDERVVLKDEFVEGSKVLSCKELEGKGYEFCPKQKVVKKPVK